MDLKLMRLAVVAAVTAIALIVAAVVASNADLLKKRNDGGGQTTEEMADPAAPTGFGDQIGDDLKAFLADEDFFDSVEEAETYSESDVIAVKLECDGHPGMLEARVLYDNTGGMVEDVPFSISVVKAGEDQGADEGRVFTDADMDGVIETDSLDEGMYLVTLREMSGYHVPSEGVEVSVTASIAFEGSASGE